MVLMKKRVSFLMLLLAAVATGAANESPIDSKYVKVGYVSNVAIPESDNSYLHCLGIINGFSSSYDLKNISATERSLNTQRLGKRVLDILFQRTPQGLQIDNLYNIALSNVAMAEDERANLDISANKQDVLKKIIVRQILKNNYVILVEGSDDIYNMAGYHYNWALYHVDITDGIIDQVFLNWNDLKRYDQITVPVSYVAHGRVKSKEEILNSVMNEAKTISPHSAIISRHPFTVGFGREQGARLLDRVEVYRLYENKHGDVKTKRICTTRITETNAKISRIFSINGGYASQSKGDIAILHHNQRLNNISIVVQGSFGSDYRIGGRLFYERLLKLSKHGVSQYILGSVEYNRYCREPEDIWYPYIDAKDCVRPTLSNFGVNVGYSFGFMGLLGKIEIAPYAMVGFKVHLFDRKVHHYDWTGQVGDEPEPTFGLDVCGGIKANINIWYPLQLTFGADYNFNLSSVGEQDVTTIYLEHHKINRLNVYAGLRFNF